MYLEQSRSQEILMFVGYITMETHIFPRYHRGLTQSVYVGLVEAAESSKGLGESSSQETLA